MCFMFCFFLVVSLLFFLMENPLNRRPNEIFGKCPIQNELNGLWFNLNDIIVTYDYVKIIQWYFFCKVLVLV